MMTHDLVATFTNGLGEEHDWKYKDIDVTLPPQEIKEACELLTTLDLFEQNGVKLFDAIVTAKIVTTKETEIFDRKTWKDEPENEQSEASLRTPIEIPERPSPLHFQAPAELDRIAVQKESAETTNQTPLLIKNTNETGTEHMTRHTETAAKASDKLSSKPAEKPKKRKGLLERTLHREKKRSKEDPRIRSGDST